MPKPDADLWMCVELPLNKTVKNQDWATGLPGLQAAGPPGRGAVPTVGRGLLGLRAAEPLGRHGPAFSKTPAHPGTTRQDPARHDPLS